MEELLKTDAPRHAERHVVVGFLVLDLSYFSCCWQNRRVRFFCWKANLDFTLKSQKLIEITSFCDIYS